MRIKLKGNRESFYLKQNVENIEIFLSGDFLFESKSNILLNIDDVKFSFEDRVFLFQISEQIKGASKDRLLLIATDNNFSKELIQKIKTASTTEVSLIKSMFLIYQWVEFELSTADFTKLNEKLNDDFVIDYSGHSGPQEELYFVPTEIITQESLPIIQRLIDLNLLVSLTIYNDDSEYISYFIPLIKPGIPREYFKTEFDKNGTKTYEFWKDILHKRDYRLRKWSQNRY